MPSPRQCDLNTAVAAPGATAKLRGLSSRQSSGIKRWEVKAVGRECKVAYRQIKRERGEKKVVVIVVIPLVDKGGK